MGTHYNNGDRILYQYIHHINSKVSVQQTKEGTFVRKVKRRGKSVYDWDANPMVVGYNGI